MDNNKLLETLRTLLQIDDIEIIKYVLESLVEDLEDNLKNKDKKV